MAKIISRFKNSDQDWTAPGATLSHDDDGNFLRGVDAAGSTWYFTGGPNWVGDLSDRFGATLTYKIRQDDTSSGFDDEDIRITGTNGTVITYSFDAVPGTDFTTFKARIDPYSNWLIDGGRVATAEEMRAVLADVATFEIRGEYRSGADAADLASVVLSEGGVTLGESTVRFENSDLVLSTFNKGGEGWSFINDLSRFAWFPDGGVSNSGHLEMVDRAVGAVVYAVAPSAFLGQKSGYYGGTLSYSAKVNNTSSPFADEDVVIRGTNGTTLAWSAGISAGMDWTEYRLVLDADAGIRLDSRSGPLASLEDIQGVLADISALEIRAEFRSGAETTGLDMVRLAAPSGRFDIVAETGASDLVATVNSFSKAMAIVTPGQTLVMQGFGPAGIEITVEDITLAGLQQVAAEVTLAPGIQTFEVKLTGGRATIDGNGRGNVITASGDSADGVRLNGKGGADLLEVIGDLPGQLYGGKGSDTLQGGDGSDKLVGGAQGDELNGGGGNDRLLGGGGRDRFVFSEDTGRDTILDYQPGRDQVVIETLPPGTGFEDLTFGTFRGHLTVELGGSNRIVFDGVTDPATLVEGDFIL